MQVKTISLKNTFVMITAKIGLKVFLKLKTILSFCYNNLILSNSLIVLMTICVFLMLDNCG